jgi:hypothetical protein
MSENQIKHIQLQIRREEIRQAHVSDPFTPQSDQAQLPASPTALGFRRASSFDTNQLLLSQTYTTEAQAFEFEAIAQNVRNGANTYP